MTAVTLTVNSVTFTFLDGNVAAVTERITPGAESTPVTAAGPAGAYLLDYEGVAKTIYLTGMLTDATSAGSRTTTGSVLTILQQKQWLESLANGLQKKIIFTSNYASQSVSSISSAVSPYQASFATTTCMVGPMEFGEVVGKPAGLPFSMNFIVGQ